MARLDRALYRLFLLLYPADFRRTHAQELEQIYAWCMTTSRQRRGLVPARVRGLADAVRGAIALRTGDAPAPPGPPRPTRARRFASSLTQDTRFALRTFRRSPFFFAGLLVVLALGIGANAAVFSLVQAVLLEPLPYREPDRVVVISAQWTSDPTAPRSYGHSAETLVTLQDSGPADLQVAGMALWQGNLDARMDLRIADRTERLRGAFVTPDFFQILGVDAAIGRVFTPSDTTTRDLPVVVSHRLWERVLDGDRNAIGREITLTTGRVKRVPRRMVVVGVLPANVRVTYPDETELWTVEDPRELSAGMMGAVRYWLVGRLAPDASLRTVEEQLRPIFSAARPEVVARQPAARFRLETMADWVSGSSRPSMLLLAVVGALLFVISCATTANALLVRTTERQREMALRTSLGAARGRLVRQLLTEGAVLATAGTLAGCAVAVALMPMLRAILPRSIPRGDELAVDPALLLFAGVAATAVTMLAAFLPAVQVRRLAPAGALKEAGGASSPGRRAVAWRAALVAAQTAFAIALIIGASMLLVSLRRLTQVPLGFDGRDVTTVEMRLIGEPYGTATPEAKARLRMLQADLMARVRAIPGITDAGLTTAVPFRGVDFSGTFDRPGCEYSPPASPPPGCGDAVGANRRTVDAGYFSVMRIPLLAGRPFQPSDDATGAPVAIVSRAFAEAMFGNQNPVGLSFTDWSEPVTIIGVVEDLRTSGFDQDRRPAVYRPSAQDPSELMCLVVRASPGTTSLGDALRRAVHDVDPSIPAMDVTTVDRIISDSVADRRFYTTTTTTFAGLALVLTAAGLIVVISRSVVERRREMAIRTALGAGSGRLVRLVAAQGLVPVIAGTATGLAAAVLGARLLEPFLFGISPRAPGVFAAGAGVVLVVATVACVLPARRLATIAPAPILRGE